MKPICLWWGIQNRFYDFNKIRKTYFLRKENTKPYDIVKKGLNIYNIVFLWKLNKTVCVLSLPLYIEIINSLCTISVNTLTTVNHIFTVL